MASGCEISIVIPVFNEAPSLGELLAKVRALNLVQAEVIVVDDGSTDGSAEIALNAGASVIRPGPSAVPSEDERVCAQVYPYSLLCEGNVPAFAQAVAGDAVALPGLDTEVNCLQMYPWSRLCGGDVGGFLCGGLLACD